MSKEKEAKDFKDMTKEELRAELEGKHRKLWDLRIQHSTAPLKNPLEIRSVRRDIARLKTYQNVQKEAAS